MKPSKPLAVVVLAASAVGVAALVSNGIQEELDASFCFQMSLILEILVFIAFTVCIFACNQKRECEVRCITVFFVLQLAVMLFLIFCLIRAGGGLF
jgi:hypothetical protein